MKSTLGLGRGGVIRGESSVLALKAEVNCWLLVVAMRRSRDYLEESENRFC